MEDKKVLTEVYEILKYLSSENFNKIPSNVINLIKENKDENYIFKYDVSKSLQEQNISRDAVAVLSYINMEYLLNDRQREFIENLHRKNEDDLEQQKREKYNSDTLFSNQNKSINKDTALVEYTKEKWYKKFINKIINIFKRNK
ncbi:MAG: hypothetical protein J6I85_04570 [Clostridia bacterium]|nr:hypothetical protein [Clostridia bacterium]